MSRAQRVPSTNPRRDRRKEPRDAATPCRKRPFSEPHARRIVDKSAVWREQGIEKRHEQRAYYCRRCDAWHVTKEPLRVQEQRETEGDAA